MADLDAQIHDAAAGPAKVTSDGLSVDAQKIPDLIAADKYLASKAAAKLPRRGLRYSKFVPPGAD